jgi:nicotinamidase-related amidase
MYWRNRKEYHPMAHDPYFDLVLQPKALPIEPESTALLVIDLQYMDAHPDGWMGRLCRDQDRPHHLDERWQGINTILPNVRALQDSCRAAGVEVIHIRIAHLTDDHRDSPRPLAITPSETPFIPLDDEFLPEIAPVGDEIIINKTSSGAFNTTMIDQILHSLGIRQLLVTGLVTEGCVELTARDALDRGYRVTLLSDGCTSSTQAGHVDALQRMGDGGKMLVRTTSSVLDELSQFVHA